MEFNEKTFQRKVNEIADKKTEPKPQPKKRNTQSETDRARERESGTEKTIKHVRTSKAKDKERKKK